MFFRLFIPVALTILNLSLFNCNQDKLQSEYEIKKNTVMIAILVRNKEHTLPYFLSYLERLDYPKDRISLWITSDNNADNSTELLRTWLEKNGPQYHGYKAVLDEESKGFSGEKGVADWTPDRYKHVIGLREDAFRAARAQWADYLWMLDADVFIANPNTLSELISYGHAISAPMLLSDGLYSNFWGGMTDTYYYRRTEEYLEILNRKKKGCFPVPMIHSAVLIDLKAELSDSLTYDPAKIPNYKGPTDDVISFAVSAATAEVPLYVCNEKLYGFILIAMEKDDDLNYDIEQLRNLKLEVLNYGLAMNTTAPLAEYVKKPPSKNLDLHRVYVISLLRRQERRARMDFCLKELDISANVYDAVDAKDLDSAQLNQMGVNMMPIYKNPYQKRPMKKGEIGCFLSHYNLWTEIIKEKPSKPVLILEDDVRFEPFFRQKLDTVLKEASRLTTDWDFLYLGRKKMHDKEEKKVGKLGILVEAGYSYWTIGYLITYQGALKLVSAKPLDNLVPVDEYIPILSDKHPRCEWKNYFKTRDLIVLSSQPLLLYPVLYSNEEGYVSDTEDSVIVSHQQKHSEL